MKVEDFRLQIEKSELCNLKSTIFGWLSRPGSRKLGAKWVGVRKRRAKASEAVMRAYLKTWPATPVGVIAQTSL